MQQMRVMTDNNPGNLQGKLLSPIPYLLANPQLKGRDPVPPIPQHKDSYLYEVVSGQAQLLTR